MPCYNPVEGWHLRVKDSYDKIVTLLSGYTIEVVLVNDGSTKNVTTECISWLNSNIDHFLFIDNITNHGKGFAVRTGASQAKFDNLVYTDIDFPYLEEDLVQMLLSIQNSEMDLIIGVRNMDYYKDIPSSRKRISLWYKSMIKRLLKIPTSDTQAGLKALSKHGKEVLLSCKIDGYLFDLELIKKCASKELSISQQNIRVKSDIILSKMPLSTLAKEMFAFLRILTS